MGSTDGSHHTVIMKVFIIVCIFIAAVSASPIMKDDQGVSHQRNKRQYTAPINISGNYQSSNVASQNNGPNTLHPEAARDATPGGSRGHFVSGNFQASNVASTGNGQNSANQG